MRLELFLTHRRKLACKSFRIVHLQEPSDSHKSILPGYFGGLCSHSRQVTCPRAHIPPSRHFWGLTLTGVKTGHPRIQSEAGMSPVILGCPIQSRTVEGYATPVIYPSKLIQEIIRLYFGCLQGLREQRLNNHSLLLKALGRISQIAQQPL